MDSALLIVIVQEYEELYNLRNPQYSNQQRRDNIWEEIGRRLNQSGTACKFQWTRIRDNHRKALNLRKTKSGQAALKMKPPKFHKELQFLTPYITDEEEKITNLTNPLPDESTDLEDEENESESQKAANTNTFQTFSRDSSPAPLHSFKYSLSSTHSRGKRLAENSTPQQSTATLLKNYLKCKTVQADSSNQPVDPLIEFFINMARTVKNFPLQDQIKLKGQLFQMVHSVEMRLAEEAL